MFFFEKKNQKTFALWRVVPGERIRQRTQVFSFFSSERKSLFRGMGLTIETIILGHQTDFPAWRSAARRLALAGIPPENTIWSVGEANDLFAGAPPTQAPSAAFAVSRGLVDLAETTIQANDPERFALLYGLIYRAHRGEKRILDDAADPLVQRITRLAQSVRRDTHKMRAFLRFRAVEADGATRYVAWFEPSHFIVEANAPFFVRRFATMTWSILTPYCSAHWDGQTVAIGPGATRQDVPDDDHLEAYWRAYFRSIFNPARLKIGAMISEMPKKYWRNLPEAAAIPDLIRTAQDRTETMVNAPIFSPERPARPPKPAPAPEAAEPGTLAALACEAAACRLCPLWQPATQTVFGEGPPQARIMMVGEQPGDQEDLAGRPFVGPAGQMLDRAIAEAGIDRKLVYVTNAVKHFKFEPRGKRRIHATPDATEIEACRFWLDQERALLKPAITILLGASAARAVLNRAVTISRERGRPIALDHGRAMVTTHPSYLLRLPDEASKAREYRNFVDDLRAAAALAA
jgi:DNA polymerase